jgi:hypothetical protein
VFRCSNNQNRDREIGLESAINNHSLSETALRSRAFFVKIDGGNSPMNRAADQPNAG